MSNRFNTRRVAMGGALGALVFLATYALKVPTVITQGYVHIGDGMIFLAAAVLGPVAWLCAGVGSALADLLGGYMIYIAPTFIIKALMGLIAGRFLPGAKPAKRIGAMVLCELIMVVGYAVAETPMYGFAAALSAVPMNLLQGAFGVAVGFALCQLAQTTKIATLARL